MGLVGDPVAHSHSPDIHRRLLRHTGLSGSYDAVRTTGDQLGAILDTMARGQWDGLNVTMPLKRLAADLVDDLGVEAALSGSVNTISRDDQRLVGDSTDAIAMRALSGQDRFGDLDSVLVLGTGGAASAVLSVLAASRNCLVSGRDVARANELAGRFGCETVDWGTPVDGALLVNATPLTTVDRGIVAPAAGLVDLPYGSEPTASFAMARELGIPAVDGTEFLVMQAVESFRIWTGVEVPLEVPLALFRKT